LTVFSFQTSREIHFGRGISAQAATSIAKLGNSVFLVHGSDGKRAQWLVAALRQSGLNCHSFTCPHEPDTALIEAGVESARTQRASVIVALGGGAAIDAGKAIAALVPSDRPMMDHLEVVGKGLPLVHAPLPFVAIPTTSGTGTEVTRNAVISVPEHHRKVSLRDARMLPDLAFVDPALTDNTPRAITLASGLDAVTQVIEPYISKASNRMTDALCREAIPLGLRALTALMQGEVQAARDDMAWVSLCGGLALANAGLGAVHGLAGVIGGVCGAPHGAICGALLPHVLRANREHPDLDSRTATRLDECMTWIAEALDAETPLATDALITWSGKCGLPGLAEMGLKEQEYPAVAKASASSSSMRGNPVPLTFETLQAILEASR